MTLLTLRGDQNLTDAEQSLSTCGSGNVNMSVCAYKLYYINYLHGISNDIYRKLKTRAPII
jgi:hypothetical protein